MIQPARCVASFVLHAVPGAWGSVSGGALPGQGRALSRVKAWGSVGVLCCQNEGPHTGGCNSRNLCSLTLCPGLSLPGLLPEPFPLLSGVAGIWGREPLARLASPLVRRAGPVPGRGSRADATVLLALGLGLRCPWRCPPNTPPAPAAAQAQLAEVLGAGVDTAVLSPALQWPG